MLGKIEGRKRRGQQIWDGWMASTTQWTWVWVDSRNWWLTGRPSVLQFMGSQRVRHHWATEMNWTELTHYFIMQKKRDCMTAYVLRSQLCLTLSNSMDYSLPGSSVHGILPLWILMWVAISSSSGSFWVRDWTHIFISNATWETPMTIYSNIFVIASYTFFIFMVWKHAICGVDILLYFITMIVLGQS